MTAAYLKDRARLLILYALYTGVTLAIGALSGEPFELFIYAAAVTGFFLLLWLTVGFFRYRQKRRLLLELQRQTDMVESSLPLEHSPVQNDYKELVLQCSKRSKQLLDAAKKAGMDSLDYYTLWIHQIKTPIAAMRMVLAETEDSEDTATLVAELFKIERYAELALKYAKLTDIANDVNIERVDLNEVVRECVRKYGVMFIRKHLTVEISPLATGVLTDKSWISFITEQFVSNAVKYTARGGVRIYMEDGALCVRDTGAGLRKEDLPRVFKKGFTGAAGRQNGKASGIGLYLADRAARGISVELSAQNCGDGAVFKARFPNEDTFKYM